MSDLLELYQETILDHGRRPRNFGVCDHATHSADGHNPLCGDQLHLTVRVRDETFEAVCFEGSGCAIRTASASLTTCPKARARAGRARGSGGADAARARKSVEVAAHRRRSVMLATRDALDASVRIK